MKVLCKQKDGFVFVIYAKKIEENSVFLHFTDDWDRVYTFHKEDVISIEVLI